jgi:hypothetical protein
MRPIQDGDSLRYGCPNAPVGMNLEIWLATFVIALGGLNQSEHACIDELIDLFG